jgi:hypothetical protein
MDDRLDIFHRHTFMIRSILGMDNRKSMPVTGAWEGGQAMRNLKMRSGSWDTFFKGESLELQVACWS